MTKPKKLVIRCFPDTKKAFKEFVASKECETYEDALRLLLNLPKPVKFR